MAFAANLIAVAGDFAYYYCLRLGPDLGLDLLDQVQEPSSLEVEPMPNYCSRLVNTHEEVMLADTVLVRPSYAYYHRRVAFEDSYHEADCMDIAASSNAGYPCPFRGRDQAYCRFLTGQPEGRCHLSGLWLVHHNCAHPLDHQGSAIYDTSLPSLHCT